MSWRDPEARRAHYRAKRAADPEKVSEYQRAQYAKHRAKRLAAKKAEREADLDADRARQRANYAKHKAKRAENAREYRRKNAEKIAAKAREKYHAEKEKINERRKGYRAKHYDKIYARIQEWRKRNPEKELIYHAKRLIAEQTGMRCADVPDDIAEAKVEQLKITRWVREVSPLSPLGGM